MTPQVCDKHRENPARVYNACIGCELDYLHAQIDALTADRAARLGEAAGASGSNMSRAVDEIRENMDYVGCDNATALEMCDEIERLQKIESTLPKDGKGKTITPGTVLWIAAADGIHKVRASFLDVEGNLYGDLKWSDCYRDRTDAEKARQR